MPAPVRRRLLHGLKVLDLTHFTPGPFTSLLLSDLGATVLKVEPPTGDPQRTDGPMDTDGVSAWYKLMNRNKSVVRIDMKSRLGSEAFGELVSRTDVLLESYRPGVLDRLGFARPYLEQLNSRLIHCALSGWGQTGPYRERPGHDLNYMAFSGALALTGTPETPAIAVPTVSDFAASLTAAFAVVSAVTASAVDRQGCFIDIGLADAVLGWMGPELTASVRSFPMDRGAGMYNGGLASYQIYRTADDRFVTLAAVEAKFWESFCRTSGRPEWIDRHSDPVPQHALIAEVAALFRAHPRTYWENLLDGTDTCFHSVVDPSELPSHPQALARQLVDVSATAEPIVDVRFPAWINGEPPPPRWPHRDVTIEQALSMF